MLNSETLKDIQKLALAGDWDSAFSGTSRGNQHLFRMVKVSLFLADQLNVGKDIVEAAAWLHDFPLTSGHDYDYERNEKVASSVLNNFSLTEEEKNRIVEAAAAHEGTGDIVSMEAKIVHDADVLEKTGILGIIRHTWKLVHSSQVADSDAVLSETVLEHLHWRAQRLQTSLAKDIHHYLMRDINMDSEFTLKLVSFIRPLAQKHVITEKIAKELQQLLTSAEYKKLEEQLSLGYLKKFEENKISPS